MGENCMFITLPAKLKKKTQHIKYIHTTLIVKARFGKNIFELSTF